MNVDGGSLLLLRLLMFDQQLKKLQLNRLLARNRTEQQTRKIEGASLQVSKTCGLRFGKQIDILWWPHPGAKMKHAQHMLTQCMSNIASSVALQVQEHLNRSCNLAKATQKIKYCKIHSSKTDVTQKRYVSPGSIHVKSTVKGQTTKFRHWKRPAGVDRDHEGQGSSDMASTNSATS